MDLGSVSFYDNGKIRNHLYNHIRNYHTLGPYQVSDEGFTFREFEGIVQNKVLVSKLE